MAEAPETHLCEAEDEAETGDLRQCGPIEIARSLGGQLKRNCTSVSPLEQRKFSFPYIHIHPTAQSRRHQYMTTTLNTISAQHMPAATS
jgi:hypothetical protein